MGSEQSYHAQGTAEDRNDLADPGEPEMVFPEMRTGKVRSTWGEIVAPILIAWAFAVGLGIGMWIAGGFSG